MPFCHRLARIEPMFTTFRDAFGLLAHLDAGVMGIVLVSLQVSLTALLLGLYVLRTYRHQTSHERLELLIC